MLLIECPHCGPRAETEYAGCSEAHIARPESGGLDMTDAEWVEWVFWRKNTKGVYLERWNHAAGCRRWINCMRDTVTNEILATYKAGEKPPKIADAEREYKF